MNTENKQTEMDTEDRPFELLRPGKHTVEIQDVDIYDYGTEKTTLEVLMFDPCNKRLGQATIWVRHPSSYIMEQHKKMLNELITATGRKLDKNGELSQLEGAIIGVRIKEFPAKVSSSFLNTTLSASKFWKVDDDFVSEPVVNSETSLADLVANLPDENKMDYLAGEFGIE